MERENAMSNNQVVDFGSLLASAIASQNNPVTNISSSPRAVVTSPTSSDVPDRSKNMATDMNAVLEMLKSLNLTPEVMAGMIANAAAQKAKPQQTDLRGIAEWGFNPSAPKAFQQVSENKDGSIALVKETRDWQLKGKSGTSTKLYVRTKYLSKDGKRMYGYDLGKLPIDKNQISEIAELLMNFCKS